MSDSNSKKPSNNPNKPTATEAETVHPTDVSLVCDDPSRHKKQPPKPTSKRGYQLLLVFGLILLFLLAMAYQTLFGHSNQAAGDLVVEEGQSYYGFLPQFQRDVPMFSASLAKLYIKATVDAPLHAGTYEVPKNASFKQLMDAFKEGQKVDMVTIQIIEGKTAADLYKAITKTEGVVLEVLESNGKPKADFKQLLGIDAFTPEGEFSSNLEGWFTPDTYYYARGITDKQILNDLYKRQQQALDKAWENRAADLPYKTPYEALIMASIIEKETSVESERELVSAVFVNRLNMGMRLQTDPTIIYGMGERYDGNIRRTDINEKTAYNTYQIDGLPPTPIALPSPESIEAAMHPADSDALYFVATGTGGHKFTKTLADHNRAVQEYLQVMREQRKADNP
ncbi:MULTISPECIES: endolytic transglycosylase MltG [Psychrobacter]|uniref:Endolytic murein transglycosylase n=1 Tax=Psychrobacter piechaudii TaxID=1945521 RepID=A0A1R4GUD8_9GAMM|nr:MULTISPECIES: endolytic transglycosylase MltG [Psychrobacter]SJM71808.1 putative aminodeoxychorismate lyase [Psychrobacter piechaudii]